MRVTPFAVLAVILPACTIAAQSEAEFTEGITAARAQMFEGNWRKAKDSLSALLERHADAPYVMGWRDAIVEDSGYAAFQLARGVPALGDAMGAELLSFNPKTYAIKLRFTPESLRLWDEITPLLEVGRGKIAPKPRLYRARMGGSYTVTLTGPIPHPMTALGLLLDVREGSRLYLDLDFAAPRSVEVYRCDDVTAHRLAWVECKGEAGDTFTIVAKVDKRQVQVAFDRRFRCKARKSDQDFGQIGILSHDWTELIVEGKVDPGWVNQEIDRALVAAREDFDLRHRPRRVLPGWLFAGSDVSRTRGKYDSAFHPAVETSVRSTSFLRECHELWEAAEYRQLRTKLEAATDADLAAPARALYLGYVLTYLGRPEAALRHFQAAESPTPELSTIRAWRARALLDMCQADAAIGELRATTKHDPGYYGGWRSLASALLRRGDLLEVHHLLQEARLTHGLGEDVGEVERWLNNAERGPLWPRRFTHQTEHYEIASDIDERACTEAGKLLETAFAGLQKELGRLPDDAPRFRAFLFGGDTSYRQYCEGVPGLPPAGSGGRYVSLTEQLVLRQQPRRDQMVRTIRLEACRQYLHQLIDMPPTWFVEGTAAFWEEPDPSRKQLDGGQPHPEYLKLLVGNRSAMLPVRELTFTGYAEFLAKPEFRRAQSWALVHLLRRTTPDHARLYDKLLEVLKGDGSPRQRLNRALVDVDWAPLDLAYRKHVMKTAFPR